MEIKKVWLLASCHAHSQIFRVIIMAVTKNFVSLLSFVSELYQTRLYVYVSYTWGSQKTKQPFHAFANVRPTGNKRSQKIVGAHGQVSGRHMEFLIRNVEWKARKNKNKKE